MDVFYPVIKTPRDNIELRFSLRSLANVCNTLGEVWIVGHKPSWVTGVCHVPIPSCKNPWFEDARKNVLLKYREVMRLSRTEEILAMNDDFYVCSPVEIGHYCRAGGVEAVLRKLSQHEQTHTCQHFKRVHRETKRLFPQGLSGSMHAPMRLHRTTWREIDAAGWFSPPHRSIRDIYVNLTREQFDWTEIDDQKFHTIPPEPLPSFISSSDAASKKSSFIPTMESLFPLISNFESEDIFPPAGLIR